MLDLAARKGPSTVAGCQLCSGVVAAMALKLLLRRGEVLAAPYHHHFDAYRDKLVVTKLPQATRARRNGSSLLIAPARLRQDGAARDGAARNSLRTPRSRRF